jgi:hypothetical protein
MQPPADLFDAALARALLGKHVLVGVTYLDADGKPTREEQVHGVVIAATAQDGFLFELRESRVGTEYRLPPDTRGFVRAQPGQYRLRGTGEVVTDPDFTCTWSVSPPRSA